MRNLLFFLKIIFFQVQARQQLLFLVEAQTDGMSGKTQMEKHLMTLKEKT
jgi:hypothetical protein